MATTPEQWLELAADAERQAAEARERGEDELADRWLRRSEGRRRMSEVEGHALMGADYRDLGSMLLAQAAADRDIDLAPLVRLARLDDDALSRAAELTA